MQLIYGFIYYFTVFMTTAICLLSVFIIPPMRRLLVKFWRTYQNFVANDIVYYAEILIFLLIGLVFVQSGYTLLILEAHFSTRSQRLVRRMGGLQNIDLVIPQSQNRDGYLLALKEYREFYLAQRNIMLVVAACFTFFVFQRLLYNIRKYAEMEHDIQEGSRLVLKSNKHSKVQ